ncbi:MAG: hypothetical protein U0S36_14290 [Candidatus Nanopelagicales bacterium]
MAVFPRGGALTAWGNAYLAGRASLDEADVHSVADDALHRVVGVPGESDPVPLSIALGRLRAAGITGLRLVLPDAGDVIGLPGPPAVTAAAVAAREAVLTVGPVEAPSWALIPTLSGDPGGVVVRWDLLEVPRSVPPAGLPTLSEAERGLAEAMTATTTTLDELDVARGRDDVAPALAAFDRSLRSLLLPPTMPQRALRTVLAATRLLGVLALAVETDGAAVTAAEAAARADALRPLRRAARYALCAAYSADVEAPAGAWGDAR